MTRLFREGRTETVRSCTMETCAFVRSMIRDETVRLNSSNTPHTSTYCATFSHWLIVIALQLFGLLFCCLERGAPQVAQNGSREAPKHVPPGYDRTGHRSPPFLPLCGFQILGRRFTFPQRGINCCCRLLWDFCSKTVTVTFVHCSQQCHIVHVRQHIPGSVFLCIYNKCLCSGVHQIITLYSDGNAERFAL